MKKLNREQIIKLFTSLDEYFSQKDREIQITVVGGVAVLLYNFISRSTIDIDLVGSNGVEEFIDACHKMGIEAHTVTVCSTVDINHADRKIVFEGQALKVYVLNPKDLIKMKLERFYKQDPEDIYKIIEGVDLGYEEFKELALEGCIDFIGREEAYFLSAQIVVEHMYPEHLEDFIKSR